MLSMKEYALNKGITYEAVRKSVSRYRDKELKGHVIKKGKLTLLDDEAISFLDDCRKGNPVSILIDDSAERIRTLEEENIRLREDLKNTENELILKNRMIIDVQNKVILLSEKEQEISQKELDFFEKLKELDHEKIEKEKLINELDKIKQELETEQQKGFFARLFRR